MPQWLREAWVRWTARHGVRTLAASPQGVTLRMSYGLSRPDDAELLPWSEIRRLSVYKRDLLTHDLICLAVELQDGRALDLHEQEEGWDAVVAAIPAHLAGSLTQGEWYPQVAKPALEARETLVYERAG